MIRWMVVLTLMQASSVALATPDFEEHREGTSVTYRDGSVVSLECRVVDQCNLTVEKGSKKWTVGHREFRSMVLLPSQLALVGRERDGRFTVEVEIACDEYSEGLPAHSCVAQFRVEDSRVVGAVVFKRTLVESRDAKPLIVEQAAPPEG